MLLNHGDKGKNLLGFAKFQFFKATVARKGGSSPKVYLFYILFVRNVDLPKPNGIKEQIHKILRFVIFMVFSELCL
jgi:hypothetical protein